jgi:hypothetical protein
MFTEPREAELSDVSERVRKWYLCSNERGLTRTFDDIKVAVISARKNTTLTPILLYNGHTRSEVSWLTDNGVEVIFTESSFSDSLRRAYGRLYGTFSAHWLRVDIPEIEGTDRYVLYTDTDVMFLSDPAMFTFQPEFLAASEEMAVGHRGHFNSGVMVMNIPNLRAVRPEFLKSIENRLEADFTYPSHDQKSFNDFFLDRVSWMDPHFNWKPYWGWDDNARIIHFHGPKPRDVDRINRDPEVSMKASFKSLYRRNMEAYATYIELYNKFLAEGD